MLAKIYSYGISGLDAFLVTIEVDVSMGIPAINIVGLPDNAIRESKERVRSAIKNSGYDFRPWRITVNLSPADIRKEGSSFDLAIALGILAATEQLPLIHLEKYAILGALSLDGSIKPVRGGLSVSLAMKTSSFQGLVLPFQNAAEACVTKSANIYPARTLQEAVQILSNPESQTPVQFSPECKKTHHKEEMDFSDIKGQLFVKRGLEIAASGSHNFLLLGPPGSGRLCTIG